jgi:hypothetical protein
MSSTRGPGYIPQEGTDIILGETKITPVNRGVVAIKVNDKLLAKSTHQTLRENSFEFVGAESAAGW